MGSYIFIIKSTSLFRYKMPPTEQQTVPLGESTIKSIGDLKTVSKAIKFPVVSDTVKAATDVVTQISENTHVETARQYLQDGIKTLSETETFNNIQGKVKELNENPRVQEVITNINLKEKVDRLDTFAADGIESLASAVPALRAPTPQLVETAKDTANSYLYLATEYLASFSVAQISLRVAERTLSLAEGTTDMLKADSDDGLLATTSTKIKQVRRAIRAVKRAGERKSILEKDPVARNGIVGSIASLLHVNTILSYLGLRLEAKQEDSEDSEIIEPMEVDEAEDLETPMDHGEVIEAPKDELAVEEPAVEATKTEEEAEVEETADDGDDNHRHIADLKGDLEGYKSEEDPDYDPARDEDVEAEDEQADKELSEEETEVSEDEKEDNEVVVGETSTTDDKVVTVDEINDKDVSLEETKDKDVSLDESKDKDVSLEETKDKEASLDESKDKDMSMEEIKEKDVSEDEKEKVSEDELKDNDVSDDEAIIEEAVEI